MKFSICEFFLRRQLKIKSVETIIKENHFLYRIANKSKIKHLVLEEANKKLVQEKDLNLDNKQETS